MCQPATCRNCSKATYRGCGMHVEQVLLGVPRADRCACDQARRGSGSGGRAGGGVLSRLFGGRKA